MGYSIYAASKNKNTYVITADGQLGADKASKAHGAKLGDLKLWKTKESLAGAIGTDPQATIDANIAREGYHVQGTEVTFEES